MPWYEVVNAKSDSYSADRDAEDLFRQFSRVLHDSDPPLEAEIYYGRTTSGARIYYFSLSPEAYDLTERVLASYDARVLDAPPDLSGLEKIRRV